MYQELLENTCYAAWDLYSSPELWALGSSASDPTVLQYFSFILSIVTCIIGFAGNIIVIFVTGFLMKKNKSKIWFLNLALADLAFLLFLPLHAVSTIRGQWPYGSTVCKFYNFLTVVNMYASIYILTALNIDRALSVAKPIWHLRFHSRRFCCCMCAVIWVSAAICSIPAFVFSDVHRDFVREQCILSFSKVCSQPSSDCELENYINFTAFFPRERCKNISDYFEISNKMELAAIWREELFETINHVVSIAMVGYCIPMGVILLSNIVIAFHVKTSKMAALSRLYRVVIVAIMSFFCTRTPLVLIHIIFAVSFYTMHFTVLYKLYIFVPLLFSVSATNSFLNPVVYVLVGKEVRKEIMKFLGKRRRRQIDI
ncbi:chemerin-like receptor 1 [Rhinoderma darwinii]|uniref:chemerin-like receptor 1 n=1 Tax=Rhinoderma darwinii TaxID=43563 RepID=UPI003F666D7C